MESPFPGMDPYIEASGLWEDFHHHLIEKIYESLADAVPPRYVVRTEQRSYHVVMERVEKVERPFSPDVKVTTSMKDKKSRRKTGGVAVAEPSEGEEAMSLRAFLADQERESYIDVYELEPELRLVTTVEVLSPANKRPGTEGWEQYQRKRRSLLLGGVNLVEIDLLRGGQRPPMLDPWPNSPYTLLVGRATFDGRCKVWRGHFQRPLPKIPVPLADPDPDVPLQLQPMIEAIYRRSRYNQSIDYQKPLKPRLSTEETAWLKGRLRERQGRS